MPLPEFERDLRALELVANGHSPYRARRLAGLPVPAGARYAAFVEGLEQLLSWRAWMVPVGPLLFLLGFVALFLPAVGIASS